MEPEKLKKELKKYVESTGMIKCPECMREKPDVTYEVSDEEGRCKLNRVGDEINNQECLKATCHSCHKTFLILIQMYATFKLAKKENNEANN